MKPIPHSRPTLGPAEAAAAARALRSGQAAQGPEVAAFELEAARFMGFRGAAAVSSGTAALELALRALGVGSGHEVLIPTYVCSALWHAVRRCGAEAVLVDSEEGGFNLSVADAARRRTRRTKALILPHLFGGAADAAGAAALGLPVVEDAAQTLKAGKRALCVASFYATKLMTSGGEGGMVFTSDPVLLGQVRDLRAYDEKGLEAPRQNAKLTDPQAAVGRVQLRRLPSFLEKRRRLARAYDRAFSGLRLSLPASARLRYVVRVPGGRVVSLLAALAREGVCARRPVFRPLHRDLGGGDFPNAERAWEEAVSLPFYPTLSAAEQARVIRAFVRNVTKTQ